MPLCKKREIDHGPWMGWLEVPILVIFLAIPGCIGIYRFGDVEIKPPISGEENDAQIYESRFGKPDSIEIDSAADGREIWTYRSKGLEGLRWRGIFLLVVVPIPLGVPVGHEETVLVVKEGRIVSSKRLVTGHIWGWFLNICCFPVKM